MEQLALPVKRYARVGLMALAMALLASALVVVLAAAHALLVRSDPDDGAVLARSPERVTAWYSQELATGMSTIQVFDAEGRQVDIGDGGVDLNDPDHASMVVSLPVPLPDGTYTVRWTAVSAEDGDPTQGEFTFSVGQEGTAADQASAATTSSLRQAADTAASNGVGWPVGWLAAGVGVLLLAVGSLILRERLA